MQQTATNTMPKGFPCGKRSPRGKLRWYLVHTGEGREQATCDKVRKLVSPDLLDDAFVMYKERWFKRRGAWFLAPVQMYKEYFFVATRDVRGLDEELQRLSFPARVAGSEERSYVPLSADAQQWFEASLDADHTLRSSTAEIVDGQLHVQTGPLRGQEARVSGVDRHRRSCKVTVCEADGGFAEIMPIDVPVKR